MIRNCDIRKRAGFTAVAGTVMAIGLMGMVGLAVDIGRMYINKNESQTFVDAAALRAALQLDGTAAGIARAKTAVTGNTDNKYNFNSVAFSSPIVEFSDTGTSNWAATPGAPSGYRFVRVQAQVNLPVYFMGVINHLLNVNVSSQAVAGQAKQTNFREGLLPFSPLAHDTNDKVDFGLVPGGIYTLRWASNPKPPGQQNGNAGGNGNGNGNGGGNNNVTVGATGTVGSKPVFANNMCYGDAVTTYQNSTTADTYTDKFAKDAEANGGSERGYIEENSSSSIKLAIEADKMIKYSMLAIDGTVEMTGGAKNAQGDALQNRIEQDTDGKEGGATVPSERYANYVAAGKGNGRRLVLLPINTYFPNYKVQGFRAFFLLRKGNYNGGGNEPFCAEYVGAYNKNSGYQGAGPSGAYVVRLME